MKKLFVIAKQDLGKLVFWNTTNYLWSNTPSYYVSEYVAEPEIQSILENDNTEQNIFILPVYNRAK